MARLTTSQKDNRAWLWALLFLLVSYAYKKFAHDFLFITVGIKRVVQPIGDFPYDCERVRHPLLEGCEDIWLDEDGRKLYAACTSVASRRGWSPGGNSYDVLARTRTDHIAVLDVDHPGSDGLYGLHTLEVGDGYQGDLDLHGFDVRDFGEKLRFWLINHRPPVDGVTGAPLDATRVGANSTVEVFDLAKGSTTLEHVRTVISDAIISPNDLAVDDDGVGFLVTNDHNTKVGTLRQLNMLYGDGSIAYCRSDTGKCHIAADIGFYFPNGITKGLDGHFYVADSAKGQVTVHHLVDERLIKIDEIPLHIPIDNLSLDAQGNIIVAAFPSPLKFLRAMNDPTTTAPATVLMIRRGAQQEGKGGRVYEVVKLVEDKEGKSLPTTTVAVRDVKSRRLFLGGVAAPFIGICKERD
ncbi:hypothetical protein BBP40_002957 [Aspergillus hancockii]|nr:hypothetical protein BBP40_002957 [Aspergillus hancockii]